MMNRLPDPKKRILSKETGNVEGRAGKIDITLLIVEDDLAALYWLDQILKERVARVIAVPDAETALTAFRNDSVDVLLTDLTLPGMSGIDLIDCIYGEEDCYTIVMTGYDDSTVLEELIKRHITFFMHKPLDVKQLFLILAQIETNLYSKKELALKEAMLRKQSVQASMGEMLSIIAHQWKQPLGIINAILADLQLDAVFSEEGGRYLEQFEQIEKETAFLAKTVELFADLFNHNKAVSLFFIGDLIEEAVVLYNHLIVSKNVSVIVDNRSSTRFSGYPDELFHVLLILLSNAIEAFDPVQEEKSLWIHIWEWQSALHLAFEDNAGGVDVQLRDRIFEPYFTTKPPGKGSGLGLYVAKMIIEGRGWGEIEFQDIPGGSRFGIRLAGQGGDHE